MYNALSRSQFHSINIQIRMLDNRALHSQRLTTMQMNVGMSARKFDFSVSVFRVRIL